MQQYIILRKFGKNYKSSCSSCASVIIKFQRNTHIDANNDQIIIFYEHSFSFLNTILPSIYNPSRILHLQHSHTPARTHTRTRIHATNKCDSNMKLVTVLVKPSNSDAPSNPIPPFTGELVSLLPFTSTPRGSRSLAFTLVALPATNQSDRTSSSSPSILSSPRSTRGGSRHPMDP